MARTRQPKPADVIELPPDFPDMVDSESLALMRETLGINDEAEATVHVYLIDAESKIDSKIWDGDADAFNLGLLAKTFGSGMYRVKIYARNADGYKPMRYNRIQGWTLSPEDEARVQAAKYAAKNPQTAPAPHNGTDMREMVTTMMAGFQSTVAQILTAQQAKPQGDPLEQMVRLAGVVKTLMPAVPVAPNPLSDLPGLLGILKTLKEVTGNDMPSEASASERLLMKAADAFLPQVAAGMQAKNAAAAAEAPAPGPAVGALEAPVVELDEEVEQMKIIERLKVEAFKLQLIAANKAAVRKVDAAKYADSLYDNFDDADIHGIALAPNWFALMCEAVPGCAAHEAWYAAVRETLIAMAVEDGLLLRDAAGNLTVPPDSGTSEDSVPEGTVNDGAVDAGTGEPAAVT